MNWRTVLQNAQDESLDIRTRLSLLERLKYSNEKGVTEVFVSGCFAWDQAIVKYCRNEVKKLPPDKFQIFLNSLFDGKFGISGNKYFQLIEELCGSEMMKYILGRIGANTLDKEQSKRIGSWIRHFGMVHRYFQAALRFPAEVAGSVLAMLMQIDSKMLLDLLDFTESLPAGTVVKVLGIIGRLEGNNDVSQQLIIRRFIEHPHPSVRARTAYLIGGNLPNIRFLNRVINDKDPQVRLSVLKSIGRFSHKFSEEIAAKITDVLYTTLADSDVRVRIKAAQILYTYRNVQGLRQLILMLKSTDSLERAYAANFLGRLKEISVRDKLKVLIEQDADKTVRLEALKALKILDEQVDILSQQFKTLGGFVTRSLLSESEKTDLLLFRRFQDLDIDVTRELVDIIGLAPDIAQQIVDSAEEIGTQGITIPLLLGTLIDDEEKISPHKIADLNQVKIRVQQMLDLLEGETPEMASDTFSELTAVYRDLIKVMLIPALTTGRPRIMVTAAKILHESGYSLGSDKLTEMVLDANFEIRREVARALSTLSTEFAAQHLRELQNDEDAIVVQIAREGIEAIAPKLERNNVPEVQLQITDYDVTDFPLVKLCVRITRENNQPIKDMDLNDFIILEVHDKLIKPALRDHKSRKPIAVSIVMDYSASMTKAAISDVEEATLGLMDNLLPTDSATIIKFAEEIDIVEKLTSDKEHLTRAIEAEYRLSTQGTALYDAIIQAINQLNAAQKSVKVVIVNTDGTDTASASQSYHVTNHAMHKDISVYTIGLGDEADTDMLRKIAELTDGLYYAINDSRKLQDVYEMIFNDIRFEYEIAFNSSLPELDESNGRVEVYLEYGKHRARDTIVLSPFSDEEKGIRTLPFLGEKAG